MFIFFLYTFTFLDGVYSLTKGERAIILLNFGIGSKYILTISILQSRKCVGYTEHFLSDILWMNMVTSDLNIGGGGGGICIFSSSIQVLEERSYHILYSSFEKRIIEITRQYIKKIDLQKDLIMITSCKKINVN
jgi:hypothetical protein